MDKADTPQNRILIVEPDGAARSALARVIEAHPALGAFCTVGERAEGSGFAAVIGPADFERPYRLGALLDKALALHKRPAARAAAVMIGPYALDPSGNSLEKADVPSVRLTEKEKEILLILHAAYPAAISREDLLERVWEYADGVQTHTLETHIYRLRQKIERDPAVPKILLTADDGYILSGN